AVYFLWHFPSSRLEPAVPDVIRHTALRSSDFPLPTPEDAKSDRPVRLPTGIILYDTAIRSSVLDSLLGSSVAPWNGANSGRSKPPFLPSSANRRW
ncbi:MAG: hypothetical protein ABSG34_14840, partial [Candidatus Sulfotelmatobacter sp.]